MKTKLLLAFLLIGIECQAQYFSGRFTTSFYTWQAREAGIAQPGSTTAPAATKLTLARLYENVQADVLGTNFGLNINAQVSKDLGTQIGTDPELRLSQLTLKARRVADVADVAVGRQFVMAGVGTGYLDGGVLKMSFLEGRVGAQAFGGYSLIDTRTINLKKKIGDNAFYGGQISAEPFTDVLVGFSYMKKSRERDSFQLTKLDSLFNPTVVTMSFDPQEEELAGFDLRYGITTETDLYLRTDYDLNNERVHRVEASGRAQVLPALAVTADYIYRMPRLQFNSIFSVFSYNETQEIEGGVEYEFAPATRAYARYGYVKYADENSGRIRLGGQWEFLNVSYSNNFGYAGDFNGISLQAVYPTADRIFVPSIGFGYAKYKISNDAESNNVMNANIGLTYRPMPMLAADIQAQWIQNPVYDNDFRVFLKFNYIFSKRLLNWF
ncbi:MAG TPA: hypothetical protein VK470_15175 [Bacteroidota bacterium]|nr:hypothetical protein [Bacteroidota bacterium]